MRSHRAWCTCQLFCFSPDQPAAKNHRLAVPSIAGPHRLAKGDLHKHYGNCFSLKKVPGVVSRKDENAMITVVDELELFEASTPHGSTTTQVHYW
jgi:hypothetical protein